MKELVASRSTENYQKAAATLVELSEALGPEVGPTRARAIAEQLRRDNPTLRILIGALKRAGLLG